MNIASNQYLMQQYLRIQQEARNQQAEREHIQSIKQADLQADLQAENQKRTQPLSHHNHTVVPSIHFVETAPSMLRELPWILLREHKVQPVYTHTHTIVYELCCFICVY